MLVPLPAHSHGERLIASGRATIRTRDLFVVGARTAGSPAEPQRVLLESGKNV